MKVRAGIATTIAGLLFAVGGSLLFGLHPMAAAAILLGGASPLLFDGQ